LKYPYAGLARLVGRPTDPDIQAAREAIPSPEAARGRFDSATPEAQKLLHALAGEGTQVGSPAPMSSATDARPDIWVLELPE
jgi:hypothetical protein